MWIRSTTAAAFVLTALACGGGGGGAGGSSSVGEYATTTADYLTSQTPEIPCRTYNVGEEFTVGEWEVRIDKVEIADPETKLPWISNSTERAVFGKEGIKGMATVYSVKNTTPMKKKFDLTIRPRGTDGEDMYRGSYNPGLYAKGAGIDNEQYYNPLPPGKWIQFVDVWATKAENADGAAFYWHHTVKEYDPTDPRGRRKINVLKDHAIVDVGTVPKADHINPERWGGKEPVVAPRRTSGSKKGIK